MHLLSDRLSRLPRRLGPATGRDATQKLPPPPLATTYTFPLPSEINDMIVSCLPPESVIALALTCRFLFRSIPSLRFAALNDDARLNLLRFLEKDVPHLYACHRCLHLHTWLRMASGLDISEYGKARLCRIKNSKRRFTLLTPPDYSYGMSYALARLITNRHLYGEQHGPPLEVLNRTVIERERLANTGIRLKQSWNARIIDDELYLEGVVQVYHKEGDEGVLRKRFDDVLPRHEGFMSMEYTGAHITKGLWRLARQGQQLKLLTGHRTLVCQHIGGPGSARTRRGHCRPIPELDVLTDSDGSLQPRTGELRSCGYCFTDFQVDFRWHPLDSKGPKGWVTTITRWHQLGNCRSHLDAKWYNYVSGRTWGLKAPRKDSCEPGMVYKNWRAADDKATGPGAAKDEDVADELTRAAFATVWWPIGYVR